MQNQANVRVHFTEKATGDTGTIDMFFPSASVRMDSLSPDTAWIEYDEFWEWANQSPHLQYGNCEWIGSQNEGDLDRQEREQEQAARLAEPNTQNSGAFGDWQPTEADIEAFRRGAAGAINAAEHDPEYAAQPKRTVQDWFNDRIRETMEQEPTPEQYQEEVENMFGEEWDRQHKQYNLRQLRYMLKSSLQREQGAYIRQRAADAEIVRLRAELAAYETKFAEPTDRAAQLARLISASGLL